MKKVIVKVLCVVVLIGFAYTYAHIDKAHEIYNPDVTTDEYFNTGILINESVEQKFENSEDELDGISIKCATFGDRANIKLKASFYTEEDKLLAAKEIAGKDIGNNKFYSINIDKIKNCKGQKFLIRLEILGGSEEDGISIYLEKSDPNAKFIRNGSSAEGTLIIRTVTHRFDWETFFVVILFEIYLMVFMRIMYKLFK